jgi:putative transposase
MLWQVAEFCGMQILTYAVMSNHFHVLVFVPPKGVVEDAELVRRYRVLYERSRAPWQPSPEVLAGMLEAGGVEAEQWRRRLTARMGDISAFMKTVKQRFSVWFNKGHTRFGTLWADRFKSVLVEGDVRALTTVAAYIDLNPVRAGLVEDPAAYRWCGYAEAMAGGKAARAGLAGVFDTREGSWKAVAAKYRKLIFGVGSGGALGEGKIDRARVLAVIEKGGKVPVAEAIRCRVRYFTDGAVLGSKGFVQDWYDAHRGPLGLRQRPSGARPMAGSDWDGLVVLRGLRRAVFC